MKKTYNLSTFATLYLNELNGSEVYNPEDKDDRFKALKTFQQNHRSSLDQGAAILAARRLIEMISKELRDEFSLIE